MDAPEHDREPRQASSARREILVRPVEPRGVRTILESNLRDACPPLNPLDILGLTTLHLWEVELLKGVPETITSIHPEDFAQLQRHAIQVECASAPDIVRTIISATGEHQGSDDDLPRLAWAAYQRWVQETLLPMTRFCTPDHAGGPTTRREAVLWDEWRKIRKQSFLKIELSRFLATLEIALHLPAGKLEAAAAEFRTDPNDCVRFLNESDPDRLDHLFLGQSGSMEISERVVSRRLGQADPTTANKPRRRVMKDGTVKRETPGADLSEGQLPHRTDRDEQAPDVTDIAELADISSLAPDDPASDLIRWIKGSVSRQDGAAVDRANAAIGAFRRVCTATTIPALRAETAHVIFQKLLSRDDLAARFGCTTEQMRHQYRKAIELAS